MPVEADSEAKTRPGDDEHSHAAPQTDTKSSETTADDAAHSGDADEVTRHRHQSAENGQTNDEELVEAEPTEFDGGNDEEEEEEEEPRLKYQRLGASVAEILSQDAASCLCVSDKILALGTHDGTVHVLDYAGNEVNSAAYHSDTSPLRSSKYNSTVACHGSI